MQRGSRRSLGVLLGTLVLVGAAGCGEDAVSPSPTVPVTANPTTVPSPTTSSAPSATPRDTVRWEPLRFEEVVPESRQMGSWTADSSGSVAYLFGGLGADGPLGDLWAYDLPADRWVQLGPIGDAPAPRSGHVAAWIDGLGLVIYGGRGSEAALDDMWIYDPEANGWRPQPATGTVPAARSGSCAALAPDGLWWVSHGAASDGSLLDDTWHYDPVRSSWTEVATGTTGPSARTGAGCWWSDDQRFALYGGRTADADATGDLWAMPAEGGGWVQLESVAGSERADAAIGRTAAAGIAFGGTSPEGTLLADMVSVGVLDLGMSLFDSTGDAPSARRGAVLVDDPGNERMLLYGGWDGSSLVDDVWSMDLP